MRNISLFICCSALMCGNVAFADTSANNISISGVKPFIGFLVGTQTIEANNIYTNNTCTYHCLVISSTTSFQYGLWGGIEFNFMQQLGIRAYTNIIYTAKPAYSNTTTKTSYLHWIFSGNMDLIYRPTQNIGIFIGLGLGDTMSGSIVSGEARTNYNIENFFTIMTNFGVQYNIDANNILELSAILNSLYTFTTQHKPKSDLMASSYSPKISVSHSIMAKYAYRF